MKHISTFTQYVLIYIALLLAAFTFVKTRHELNEINDGIEYQSIRAGWPEYDKLFRLLTKKTNVIEIGFGPGIYDEVRIYTANKYPLIIHGAENHTTILTNTMLIDTFDGKDVAENVLVHGFFFDSTLAPENAMFMSISPTDETNFPPAVAKPDQH